MTTHANTQADAYTPPQTFCMFFRSVIAAKDYANAYGFKLDETESFAPGHVVARYSEPLAAGDDAQAYTLARIGYLPVLHPELTLNAGDVHQALRTAIVYLQRNGWTVHDAEIDPDFKDAADLAASRGAEVATFTLDRQSQG